MEKYTVRITQENENWIAWIDQDESICIRQEINPNTNLSFSTETDARNWADKHSTQLEATYLQSVANKAQAEADLALDRAYKEAMILSTLKQFE
jgi:hypothetical protein